MIEIIDSTDELRPSRRLEQADGGWLNSIATTIVTRLTRHYVVVSVEQETCVGGSNQLTDR